MSSINSKSIFRKMGVAVGNSRVARAKVKDFAKKKVDKAQLDLLREFNQNPITLELEAGPTAYNTSGTLGGYGNLYSFLGFHANKAPSLQKIRNILARKPNSYRTYYKGKGVFKTIIKGLPNSQDVLEATSGDLPWTTRSWVNMVEQGVSGFQSYLFLKKLKATSRSGYGLQLKSGKSVLKFKNTSYVSRMLRKFNKKFSP